MAALLSGVFLIIAATAFIYGIDALASSRRRSHRWQDAGWAVAGFLVATGVIVPWLIFPDREASVAIGIGIAAAGLTLAAVLPVQIRRAISTLLPMDADSPRDWVGLVALLWLVIGRLVLFYSVDAEVEGVEFAEALIQMLMLVAIAFALIGLYVRRGLRQALDRLGLRWPSVRSIAIGTLTVIPFAIITAATAYAVEAVQPGTLDRLDEAVSDLTGGQSGLGFALALGISAAVGEETLFRGALQPKYGLVLTALIFALLHVQYDLLLIVASLFPAGILLGLERRYLGTSAAIITHALYNALAVVANGG